MITRPWPIVVVAALLFLLPLSEVAARTWDVPSEIPTIQAAIDTSADGDTIAVAAGTYQERLQITGKGVVLIGLAGAANTVLSGLGFPFDGTSLVELLSPPDTTVITGFTFEDADGVYGGAIYCEDHRLTLSENIFRRNLAGAGGAVLMWGGHLISAENLFEENTSWDGGGAVMIYPGATAEITGNVFRGNTAVGDGQTGPIGSGAAISLFWAGDSTLISENLIFGNEAGYGAIMVDDSGYTILDHNTIVLNRSWTIEPHRSAGISVRSSSVMLRNNIVALNQNGWGISISHGAVVTLECNDFWQNGLGDYFVHFTGGTFIGTTDLSANPLLCDPAAGDLTLAEGSPCLPENSGGCGLVGALGVGCGETVGVEPPAPALPAPVLTPPLPNPFSSTTRITYSLPNPQHVTLAIYDIRGRLVATLVDGEQGVGEYTVSWDGRLARGTSASGLYFVRLKAGEVTKTQKLMFVR